jgi:SAM-dependent methyltransferase
VNARRGIAQPAPRFAATLSRMPMQLYGELVPWYRLLDPPADHLDEATSYQQAFERAVSPRAETLLDLGAGAGHNAVHLKHRFRCTLTDPSLEMLGLSRDLNPECEHLPGDMRTLRLGRTFDAVLVHDAVMYMRSPDDLRAAAETAFVHTRPGGAALFAPDCMRDTFEEQTEMYSEQDGARALRCLAWTWDPDPRDDTYNVEYAFLLRDGVEMKAVHDRHVEGLFARATWTGILGDVGFTVEMIDRPLDDGKFDQVFLCRRPEGSP